MKSIETYVRNIADDLREARSEHQQQHDELLGEIKDVKNRENDAAQAKARTDILPWISKIDHNTNYHAALKPSLHSSDGAGDWFIKGSDFQEWIQTKATKPKRLLLSGIC